MASLNTRILELLAGADEGVPVDELAEALPTASEVELRAALIDGRRLEYWTSESGVYAITDHDREALVARRGGAKARAAAANPTPKEDPCPSATNAESTTPTTPSACETAAATPAATPANAPTPRATGRRTTRSASPTTAPASKPVATTSDAAVNAPAKPPLRKASRRAEIRRCRTCGCTDDDCRQCIEKTGQACHWIAEDLCSACAPAEPVLALPRRQKQPASAPPRPRRPSAPRRAFRCTAGDEQLVSGQLAAAAITRDLYAVACWTRILRAVRSCQ